MSLFGAGDLGELILRLRTENEQLKRGLREAETVTAASAKKMGASLQATEISAASVGSQLQSTANAATLLGSSFGGPIASAAALTGSLRSVVLALGPVAIGLTLITAAGALMFSTWREGSQAAEDAAESQRKAAEDAAASQAAVNATLVDQNIILAGWVTQLDLVTDAKERQLRTTQQLLIADKKFRLEVVAAGATAATKAEGTGRQADVLAAARTGPVEVLQVTHQQALADIQQDIDRLIAAPGAFKRRGLGLLREFRPETQTAIDNLQRLREELELKHLRDVDALELSLHRDRQQRMNALLDQDRALHAWRKAMRAEELRWRLQTGAATAAEMTTVAQGLISAAQGRMALQEHFKQFVGTLPPGQRDEARKALGVGAAAAPTSFGRQTTFLDRIPELATRMSSRLERMGLMRLEAMSGTGTSGDPQRKQLTETKTTNRILERIERGGGMAN